MANPQLEDGHTRIANELLDQLACLHLSPNQWQVVLFIIRKTYGYRKKMDHITNSQIVKGTGIYKTHVSRTIRELVNRRIFTRVGKLIGLQKDYELWLPQLPKLVTIDTEVAKTGNNTSLSSYQNRYQKLPILESELPKEVTKVTSSLDTQKKKENVQNKKEIYEEFENVLLANGEYQKLVTKFGEERAKSEIENFQDELELLKSTL